MWIYTALRSQRVKADWDMRSEVLGAEAEWSTVCELWYHDEAKVSEDQKRKMCTGDWTVHVVDRPGGLLAAICNG